MRRWRRWAACPAISPRDRRPSCWCISGAARRWSSSAGRTRPAVSDPQSFVPQEIVAGEERWFSNAATQADLDGDGHLDLIIGNYFADGARILDPHATEGDTMQHSMSRALNGAGPRVLMWTGATRGAHPSVSYRDATDEAVPEAARHGWTLAVGAADLSGSSVAGPLSGQRLRSGSAARQSLDARAIRCSPWCRASAACSCPSRRRSGYNSFKGMGVDFADIDARGLLDIFVSNITESYALEESNFVFMNTGRSEDLAKGIAPFIDQSEARGLSRSGWSWDAKLDDFDNSGQLEVLQATGFVHGVGRPLAGTAGARDGERPVVARASRVAAGHAGRRSQRPGPQPVLRCRTRTDITSTSPPNSDWSPPTSRRPRAASRSPTRSATEGWTSRSPTSGATRFSTGIFRPTDAPLSRPVVAPAGRGTGRSARRRKAVQTPRRRPVRRSERPPPSRCPTAGGARRRWTAATAIPASARPNLHFGLGDVAADAAIPVDLKWRDAGGVVRQARLTLSPGWHTIMLGADAGGSRDAHPGG